MQDCFLTLHLKRHLWDPSRPLVPWVRALVSNKCLDALRRKSSTKTLPIEDFENILSAPDTQVATTHSPTELQTLVHRLKGRSRDVLTAVALQGMSIKAAATALGLSEGNARVALHRGYQDASGYQPEIADMKLQDLLRTLAEDDRRQSAPLPRQLVMASALGLLVSSLLVLSLAGSRPDWLTAIFSRDDSGQGWRGALLIGSASLALREAVQPTPTSKQVLALLWAAPLLLLITASVELLTSPANVWRVTSWERIRAMCHDGATAIHPSAGCRILRVTKRGRAITHSSRGVSRFAVRRPGGERLYASLHGRRAAICDDMVRVRSTHCFCVRCRARTAACCAGSW